MNSLVMADQFHSLINRPTYNIVFCIVVIYLGIVFVFAVVYWLISHGEQPCNLGLRDLRASYLFSLETMTTVGYGTSDYLFGECWIMLPVLTAQAFCSLLMDAFLFGTLFLRLSRPQTRASTVVFSKNAVIRRVRGEAYFMFQIGELRKHQLLETRVRCYALRHERLTPVRLSGNAGKGVGDLESGGVDGSIGGRGEDACMADAHADLSRRQPDQVFFQCHYMRLQHPDDELGGNLLLVLPQTVVHRIDAWSPMMPPPRWNSSNGTVQWGLHQDKAEIARKPPTPRGPDRRPPGQEVYGKRAFSGCVETLSPRRTSPVGTADPTPSQSHREATVSESTWSTGFALGSSSDIVRAPWEENEDGDGDQPSYAGGGVENDSVGDPTQASAQPRSEKSLASAQPRKEKGLASAHPRKEKSLEKSPKRSGHLAKKESQYWAEDSGDRSSTTRDQDNSVGYLYRFPDLLKRWDDVDGDRGTWYEVMKRRMLRVEMERRREEERKAAQAAAEAAPQGHRPRRRRAPSIINIAGLDLAQSAADRSHPPRAPPKGSSPPSGGFPPTPASGHGTTLSPAQWLAREERKAIDAYLQDRELEVVVILEGTDTSTGNTVQARHSYCWEDIRWDRTFASCVSRTEDGACEVDFSKFHETLDAPADCSDHGFIQSYA